jgi:hypothetical protein
LGTECERGDRDNLYSEKINWNIMNISVDEVLNQYLDANAIAEDIIITNLLKSSDKFKDFYENEIKNENLKIYWIYNKTIGYDDPLNPLPDEVLGAGIKLNVNEWVIILRNLNDETVIAHELAHVKINCDEFPLTCLYPKYCKDKEMTFFLTSLNNLIHDPLVIIKLKSYRYDLRREYIHECQKAIKCLQNTDYRPNGIEEIRLVFDYVKNTLEHEILFGEKKTACNQYNKIFGQKFGSVKVKGEELLILISEIGFKSPDNVHRIYNILIEKLSLSEFIYVEL